jgi:aldehyde dehydrogenase (NAD+)
MKNLDAAATQFLSQDPIPLFIGGEWRTAAEGGTLDVHDPGDGRVVARVAAGEAADIDQAVQAAQKAFDEAPWARLPVNDRAVLLHRLADLVEQRLDTLAQLEALDVGKPLDAARTIDIPNVAQTLRYYADLSVRTRRSEPIAVPHYEARSLRVPYGPCAFIFPWNFPLLLVGWGIAPALAAGNTVVIKPAEDTPLSTLYFCRLVEEAGLPAGVVNAVPGLGETAGAALAAHPGIKRLSFTGSPEVGRAVARACGENLVPVKLELGGKGAAVVFDDVDLEATAQALAGTITFNTGQVCCTATRWIVHERIHEPLVARIKEILQATAIGHELDEDTQMGPLISEKQRRRVLGYLERGQQQGCQLLLEGGPAQVPGHEGGYYVKPALLSGALDSVCWREEIFGPVACVATFKDEAEAVALANRTAYGLANSVWTQDLDRANRVAEAMVAGNSWINGHNLFPHGVPYGGCNLSGMGGGVLGPETYLDYLRSQSIVRPLE